MEDDALITRIEDGILSAIQNGGGDPDTGSADPPHISGGDGQIIVDGDVSLTEIARAVVASILEPLNDRELVATYQQSGGEPGHPIADLLALEAERRGVDF